VPRLWSVAAVVVVVVAVSGCDASGTGTAAPEPSPDTSSRAAIDDGGGTARGAGTLNGACGPFVVAFARVSAEAATVATARDPAAARQLRDDLRLLQLGVPASLALPLATWSQAVDRVAAQTESAATAPGSGPSGSSVAAASGALTTPEVVAARERIDAYVSGGCSAR
jgi:hypothetical protein